MSAEGRAQILLIARERVFSYPRLAKLKRAPLYIQTECDEGARDGIDTWLMGISF